MSNRPAGSSHPSLLMGGISTAGGLVGFLKTGSKPSLIGGSAVGAAFGLSAYLINKNDDNGYDLGYLSAMALVWKFAPGELGKPTLRGGIAASALVVGIYNGMKSFESKGII